ncbi:hypothetical protein ACLB2K_046942 [Fragaria x ananassa]
MSDARDSSYPRSRMLVILGVRKESLEFQRGQKLTPTTVCGCRYYALRQDSGEELGVHIYGWCSLGRDIPRHRSFTVSDIEAMTFNTVDEAENFYAAYSVAVGFGIRKGDKDETVQTYTWLLSKFLVSMNGKMKKVVITDGDKVMRNAIRTVMPEARHRLCIWHIGQNANSHLKSAEKLKAFNRCIRKYQTVEQFDRLWQDMLDEFDLHNND